MVDDDLKELQTTIAKWRGNIEDKTAVGHSRVDLEGGDKCWQGECNLGNLMADAVVHCILRNLGDEVFKYPLHAIYHGGAFFEETVKGGGKPLIFTLIIKLVYICKFTILLLLLKLF